MNGEVKPGYKLTEVGVFSEDWRDCDISDLCTLQRGFDLTEATRKPGVVPVYSSSGLSYFHNEAKLQPPSVITGRKGLLGKVFLVDEPCWPHDTTLWVKDFKGNDPRFVSVFLSYFNLKRFDAATSVPTLNRNNLVGYPIHLPPLPEQEAIAEALSDADALIESLEQLITKKRQIKQGAMQELLTGKKRLSGFSGEWEVKKLGDLFSFSGGYSASRDQLSSEGHCYLHYGDIHGSSKMIIDAKDDYQNIPKLNIPLKRIASNSLLEDGDVVFVDASEDDEGTSRYIVVVNKDDIPFIAGLHTIVAKSKTSELTHEYRRYCFQTADIHQQFLFFAVGTKVSGISKSNIPKLTLPVPPFPEQAAIAEILMDMEAEIDAQEVKLEKARKIKYGMMHNLLTGKIRLI